MSSFFNIIVGCRPAETSLEEHLDEHLSVPVYGIKLVTRYLNRVFCFEIIFSFSGFGCDAIF